MPSAPQVPGQEAGPGQPHQPTALAANKTLAPYLSPWESADTFSTENLTEVQAAAEALPPSAEGATSSAGQDTVASQDTQCAPRLMPAATLWVAGRWVVLIAGTLLVAGVVFWGGRQWLFVGRMPDSNRPPGTFQPTIKPSDKRTNVSDLLVGHWTDASRAALKLGVYEVRVVGAELGPVLGRDQQRRVITVADLGLQVLIEVRNRSDEPTSYRSWYAVAVQGEQAVGVDLLDNAGNRYPLLAFPEGMQIRHHTAGAELDPGQRVRDVLIFHLPSQVDRSQVTEFFLWLDVASQGGEGELRFKIPLSMVRHW